MRANTKRKHEMGKRFAIVIGVAAVGVMALGAQTAAATYKNTKLTIDGGSQGGHFLGLRGRQATGRSARLGDG